MKEVELTKKELEEEKHHTRRLSIKEGIFWSLKISFGDQYIAPFVIAVGTSSPMVAVINSLWSLGSAAQLFGSNLLKKFKRKSIVKNMVSLEAIGWMFIAIIAVLYHQNILTNLLPYLIIISLTIALLAGGLGHPAWFSWMGDVVDSKFRGRWFSKRNTIISFTTIILAITAALMIEYFKKIGQLEIGFIILFSVAFLARAYCVKIFRKYYEPKLKRKKEKEYSIKKFIKESRTSNFGKLVFFRGTLAFVVGLTTPLISIYLLRNLGFDYFSYILIVLAGTFFSVLTLNLWGKIADKYGNYRVIAITTLLIPLTPILWILSTSKIYLFFIPAIIGGTAWSAFAMGSGNFIYDNVNREKRAKAISYFNLFLGIGAFLGGITGAFLIKTINTTWIEPIYLIMIIGSLARMAVVGFWIPRLKEIKNKKRFKGIKDFEDIILKEAKPTLTEDLHEIVSIKDYIKEK